MDLGSAMLYKGHPFASTADFAAVVKTCEQLLGCKLKEDTKGLRYMSFSCFTHHCPYNVKVGCGEGGDLNIATFINHSDYCVAIPPMPSKSELVKDPSLHSIVLNSKRGKNMQEIINQYQQGKGENLLHWVPQHTMYRIIKAIREEDKKNQGST